MHALPVHTDCREPLVQSRNFPLPAGYRPSLGQKGSGDSSSSYGRYPTEVSRTWVGLPENFNPRNGTLETPGSSTSKLTAITTNSSDASAGKKEHGLCYLGYRQNTMNSDGDSCSWVEGHATACCENVSKLSSRRRRFISATNTPNSILSVFRVHLDLSLRFLGIFWNYLLSSAVVFVVVFLVVSIFCLGSYLLLKILMQRDFVSSIFTPGLLLQFVFFSSAQREWIYDKTGDQITSEQNETDRNSNGHKRDQSCNQESVNGHGTHGIKKRTVSSRKNSRGKTNDDESDGDDQNPASLKRQRVEIEKAKPMFACPFYKHNAQMYRSERACVGPGWTTVHRVKEHLYRRHRLPEHQCPRCDQTFDLERDIRSHLKQEPPCIVAKNGLPPQEGIDKDQAEQLKSRKRLNPNMSEEEKWYEMYKIIFPDAKLPETPYYDFKAADKATQSTNITPEDLGQRIHAELIAIDGNLSSPKYKEAIDSAVRNALNQVHRPNLQLDTGFGSSVLEYNGPQQNAAPMAMIPTPADDNQETPSYTNSNSILELEQFNHLYGPGFSFRMPGSPSGENLNFGQDPGYIFPDPPAIPLFMEYNDYTIPSSSSYEAQNY